MQQTTVRVVALKDHIYAGIERKTGEQYDAHDMVDGLLAVGFAAKVMEAESEDVWPAIQSPKAEYNRRDMRAKR